MTRCTAGVRDALLTNVAMMLLTAVAIAGVIVGCRSQNEPAPKTSPQQAALTREKLQSENPAALIGDVVDVVPESQLCAVGNLDVSKLRVGDSIVFYSTDVLATGNVVGMANGQLRVRYEPYGSHGRAPQLGDLAVHIPE